MKLHVADFAWEQLPKRHALELELIASSLECLLLLFVEIDGRIYDLVLLLVLCFCGGAR